MSFIIHFLKKNVTPIRKRIKPTIAVTGPEVGEEDVQVVILLLTMKLH